MAPRIGDRIARTSASVVRDAASRDVAINYRYAQILALIGHIILIRSSVIGSISAYANEPLTSDASISDVDADVGTTSASTFTEINRLTFNVSSAQ